MTPYFKTLEEETFRQIQRDCAWIARSHKFPQAPRIELSWNARFTRRMGDALVTQRGEHPAGRIRLSSALWEHATVSKRRNTMIHEIAHLYAELEHPGAHHNAVWKRWMIRFGVKNPQRCYSLDKATFSDVEAVKAKRRRQPRYRAQCSGCWRSLVFSKGARTRWVRLGYSRCCRGCGTVLTAAWAKAATLELDS